MTQWKQVYTLIKTSNRRIVCTIILAFPCHILYIGFLLNGF